MVLGITTGRDRQCRDSQGGIEEVYIFPYVKYPRSAIEINGSVLISFPETTIYEFYVVGNPTAVQTQNEDAGGKSYAQSLSLNFPKIENGKELEKLLKKDVRIIIRDRNGKYILLGAYVGLECVSLAQNTGGSKQDFNGFTAVFEGKEEKGFMFIENLEDAGFVIMPEFFLMYQNSEIFTLQNNDYLITQNG